MNGFTSIVCVKPVPDPECPPSSLEIDREAVTITPIGVPPVINPYDENALEAALRVRDAQGGRVVALSMVEKQAATVLHKARVAADELVVLQDGLFKDLDPVSTASVLAAAISRIGAFDLVLLGRQSADWGFGQTGPFLAEILGLPVLHVVADVRVEKGHVWVKRLRRSGYDLIRAPLPAVVTTSSEVGGLRLFSLKEIRDARLKPQTVWDVTNLGLSPERLSVRKPFLLSPPPSRKRNCLMVDGDSLQEKAHALAHRLRKDRVL